MAKFKVRHVIDFFIVGESADYAKGYVLGICDPYVVSIMKTARIVDVLTESGVESVRGLSKDEAANYPFISHSEGTETEESPDDFDPLTLLDDDQEVE